MTGWFSCILEAGQLALAGARIDFRAYGTGGSVLTIFTTCMASFACTCRVMNNKLVQNNSTCSFSRLRNNTTTAVEVVAFKTWLSYK